MGNKHKKSLGKLSRDKRKLVKQMGRTNDKIRRAKIQKLKNCAQKINTKELKIP